MKGKAFFAFGICVASLLLTACPTPSTTPTPTPTPTPLPTTAAAFAYTDANPVYAVSMTGSSAVNLTISGATGKSVYLVKANTKSSAITSFLTGSASSVSGALPALDAVEAIQPSYARKAETVQRREHAAAAAFSANPPAFQRPAASRFASILSSGPSASVAYGPADPALTVNSSTWNFNVQNATGGWIQIPATLRAIGQYCYIWVADANYDNTSPSTTDNKITSAQATSLETGFDGSPGATYNDGVFKNVTNIFGYEYGGGAGGDGGVDGDQHISILVYDIDFDYTPPQTGGTYGFFWPKDMYSQAALDAAYGAPSAPQTNLKEMFYVDANFTDRFMNSIISTLAHEYQHMINFNQKSVINNLSSPTWYNEMCSMVSEDLVLANLGLSPVTDGAIDRLGQYAYHYAESGVEDWLSGYDVLKSYASAFAFGAFLERNYGGATLFKNISSNASVGEASITAALAAGGYGDAFADAFKKYAQTLVFTDKPTGSSVATLKQAVTAPIASPYPISYTAVAVDYDALKQVNLDTGLYTGNYGIRSYAPSTLVTLRPYGFSVHTQSSWQSLTGNITIKLNAPSDSGVLFYVMVK